MELLVTEVDDERGHGYFKDTNIVLKADIEISNQDS